jgi:uncharacterized protein YjbI with pentapeptide repeats
MNLTKQALSDAKLTDAFLYGADLSDANLNGTTGWTDAQLTDAKSLDKATVPNGQMYED